MLPERLVHEESGRANGENSRWKFEGGGVLEIVTTCLWPNLGFPQDIVEYNNNLPLFSAQSGVLES